ncbi:terminase small subunit [Tropicimonas marinistellae]|uniref:terminase small subunit n=1 Tax=Tropicimonas marinistellae TaxID=1739787 RepID=UPI000837A301|nr:terminase small subunit [Tropicimonas marinistellae]
MKLTPKQRRFVEEYLTDLNATQAAIRAGYSQQTAREIGYENMTKPHISAAISAAQAERSRRLRLSQDAVLQGLAKIGFADIRKIFTADGKLKAVADLDDDIAGAIAAVDVVTRTVPTKKGEEADVVCVNRIRFSDKRAALVEIAKLQGYYDETDPEEEHTKGLRALANAICSHAGSMPIMTQQTACDADDMDSLPPPRRGN